MTQEQPKLDSPGQQTPEQTLGPLLPTRAQVLAAIRYGLELQVAPELTTPMAKTICRMANELLDDLIVEDAYGDQILERQIERHQSILSNIAGALGDPGSSGAIALLKKRRSAGLAEDMQQTNRDVNFALERALPRLLKGSGGNSDAARTDQILRDLVASLKSTEDEVASAAKAHAQVYRTTITARPDITPDKLQRYLRQRFADRPELEVVQVREIPGGFSKQTYLFDLRGFESGVTSLVLRRNRAGGCTGTMVEDEFALLQSVYAQGLPVPEPLWLEADASKLDGAFIVMRKVDGQAGGHLYGTYTEVCNADTALEFAAILARLHKIDPASVGFAGASASGTQNPADALIKDIRRLWQVAKLEPDPVMEAALSWLERNMPPPPKRVSIVHGDVALWNVLVVDKKVNSILDWELAHPGDPIEDLSYVQPQIEALMPWRDFLAEYRKQGGGEYSETTAQYYGIWRGVRNSVFTLRCNYGFVTDQSPDLRMAHSGVHIYRRVLLDAAEKISELGASLPKGLG